VPVPYVDAKAAELLFRHKVIAFLRDEQLLSDERIELLLSWQSAPSWATNTGFSVHNGVTVGADDVAGTERLARYLLRPPLSVERMSLNVDGSVLYRRKSRGRLGGAPATFDALDLQPRGDGLARLLIHIPQPKLHTVRYYGEYSSVARARRRRRRSTEGKTLLPEANGNAPWDLSGKWDTFESWARCRRTPLHLGLPPGPLAPWTPPVSC
jgi:hypothetical protein